MKQNVVLVLFVLVFVFLVEKWEMVSCGCGIVDEKLEIKHSTSLRVAGTTQPNVLLRDPYSKNFAQPELIAVLNHPEGSSIVRFAPSKRTAEETLDFLRYSIDIPKERLYLHSSDLILRVDLVQAGIDEYYMFILRDMDDKEGKLSISRIKDVVR